LKVHVRNLSVPVYIKAGKQLLELLLRKCEAPMMEILSELFRLDGATPLLIEVTECLL
jgi:hypothetical protein